MTGTVAEGPLDASVTISPPSGAADDKVTTPSLDVPPTTDAKPKDTELSTGAVIPTDADREPEDNVAVTVAETFAATAVVLTVNVTDL